MGTGILFSILSFNFLPFSDLSANIYLRKKQAYQEVPTRVVLRLQVLHIVVFKTMTLDFGLPQMVFSLWFPQCHYLSVAQWYHPFFSDQ